MTQLNQPTVQQDDPFFGLLKLVQGEQYSARRSFIARNTWCYDTSLPLPIHPSATVAVFLHDTLVYQHTEQTGPYTWRIFIHQDSNQIIALSYKYLTDIIEHVHDYSLGRERRLQMVAAELERNPNAFKR